MTTRQVLMGMVLSAVLAMPVGAQTPRWSAAFNLGAEVPLSGDVHGGGTGTVLNLPTTVQARTYNDIYGNPFTWSADFGYAPTPNGELRVRLHRTSREADRVQVGDVATLPLFAQFDKYTALGVDFGYRQYIASETSRVKPFVGGSVGFVNVDAIEADFTVPAASVVLSNVPMYGASTLPAFAVSGGALFSMTDNFGIQAGVDFRWQNDLEPKDGLAGTGLEGINDQSRRWSMPITVRTVVRF